MNELLLLGGFTVISLFGMAVVGVAAYQHGRLDAFREVQNMMLEED
jgi:hypothetical protein